MNGTKIASNYQKTRKKRAVQQLLLGYVKILLKLHNNTQEYTKKADEKKNGNERKTRVHTEICTSAEFRSQHGNDLESSAGRKRQLE